MAGHRSPDIPILDQLWRGFQGLLAGLCLVGMVVAVARHGEAEVVSAEIPSWRLGIPTWNGSRYVAPPPAVAPPSQVDAVEQVDLAQQLDAWALSGLSGVGRSGSVVEPTKPVYHVPNDPSRRQNPPSQVTSASTADAWQAPNRYAAVGVGLHTDGSDGSGEPVVSGRVQTASGQIPLPPPLADPALADAAEDLMLLDPVDGSGFDGAAIPRLAEQLDAPMALEEPPLQEDALRWYEYPLRWFSSGWKNHAEFGLNGSDGNAKTLAVQTGLEMKRKTDLYTFAIDLDYRQASNRNQTTENNGRFNVDYDRMVGESAWSMFGKLGLEWDEFKAFDLRLNLNGGIGYHWLRDEQTTLVTRFGSGSSRPFGAPIDRWTQEAVFGIDLEHQLTPRQKLKAKVDYFPAWADFSEFRVVSDLSWEVLLDGSDNLSLKLAVTDRYDSTPQGARPNDVYYSMLMLYKF